MFQVHESRKPQGRKKLTAERHAYFEYMKADMTATAVAAVFDHPVVARCQLHEIRNVEAKLPKALAKTVFAKMRAIGHLHKALVAEAELEELARQLTHWHPGAAGSFREELAEKLAVMDLKVPPMLAHTLRSTNAIESMIEICRDHPTNVERWRDGQMALRWFAAGMVEAARRFRKVNGFMHLPELRKKLDAMIAKEVDTFVEYDKAVA